MKKLNCEQANQIGLVDYLPSLGYRPAKITNQDYCYLSPLREENTPTFKVNRKLNVCYAHAIGKGGGLIDFGTQYFKCTISDLLQRRSQTFSFHPPQRADELKSKANPLGKEREGSPESKIQIVEVRPQKGEALLDYLAQRYISLAAALPYCRQVDFIDAGDKELKVFEAFLTSFQTLQQGLFRDKKAALISLLKSLPFFKKSRPVMKQHGWINLISTMTHRVSKPPNRRCMG